MGVSSLFLLVDLFTTSLRAAFLVLGSVYVDQGSKIRFIGSWISFLDCLFSPGWLFGQTEPIIVTGALQEAGHADSGLAPNPKCKLITSSFLTLPHLRDCLICTRNAMSIEFLLQMTGGYDRWGVVDLY